MKKTLPVKSAYQEALESYYRSLKSPEKSANAQQTCSFLGLSGDLIWSSAVLMVVDKLPKGEREEKFVEITLNNAKEISATKIYQKAA